MFIGGLGQQTAKSREQAYNKKSETADSTKQQTEESNK
jgi:hypothetical protein